MAEETKVEKEVTEEVEENKEAEAEVVEEEKVDQEDQIKILQGEVDVHFEKAVGEYALNGGYGKH